MLISRGVVAIVMIFTLVFPNYISMLLGISSTAPGLLASSLVISFVYVGILSVDNKIALPSSYIKNYTLTMLLVLFIYILTITINDYDFLHTRFLSSYLFLIGIMFVGAFLNDIILRCKTTDFNDIVSFIFWIFLFLGVISTYLILNNIIPGKSMILFTEPSHYALFFSPFLLYKSYMEFNKRKKNLFIYLLLTFFIAILVENVTLLVGLIATLVVLYATKLRYFLPIVIAMIFFVINSEYFSTRMPLSTEVSNLSVLVYLSGWERAYLALIDSYGLGLGFQQMGIGLEGIFMESLSKAGAGGLNYNDGGTLGSKIVAELGFLGIAFLIMYIKVGVHIFLSMIKNTGHLTSKVVFFNSIYLMMSLSIFIRAAGYFNSISLMFLLSLIWIYKEDKSYFKEL